ncbi:hypothetical protein KHQ82_05395 [Mycoplasmatota bacterium]|nr:hypothetical protein KHQ82_05395 [Mycoplasmatota bacterium]
MYYMLLGSTFGRTELSKTFGVDTRTVSRYVSEINVFFMNNYINHKIVYAGELKKYRME